MLSTNVAFFVSYLIILRNLNFPQLYCFYHSISNKHRDSDLPKRLPEEQ